MIQINIKVSDGKVLGNLLDKDSYLAEVGAALLRLKQIEQELIDRKFESELELNKQKGDDE